MSMHPSLSPAPEGIDELLEPVGVAEVEIVIMDDDALPEELCPEECGAFGDNLAELLEDGELASISTELMTLVDADIESRKDWVDMYIKGLEVLGMRYEERTIPWAGACGVYSTLLTEAAIRFQSETIVETFPAQGPVKTQIVGAIDALKEEAAERVREDMNYQLTEVMEEYRPEHERMLFNLGLAGAAFKKVYFDPTLGRQVAMFVTAEDLIIPYGASSAATSPRVTHIMRKTKNEVRKLQEAGFYRDVDLGDPKSTHTELEQKKAKDQGYELVDDDRYQLLEVHVDYVMPGEDEDEDSAIARPYVITFDKSSTKVLSIRRNWREEDPLKLKRQHFVQYSYVVGFGAYGLGLIHIIGGYARAGTSLIRQLVDAGTLSNLPGGLKTRGLRIKGDDSPISPGEFRDVDIPSGTIRDNLMALPYKEPSQVLAALLQTITEEGRRLGSIADMNVSDMSANSPVGTTLAILERQLKTMSAVQARVHASMKQEFKLLKEVMRDNMDEGYDYEVSGGDRKIKQRDYDIVNVIPVSDPNATTMAQRIMQYQAVMQMSQQAPQIYDLPQLHRQMVEVLGVKNADKLIPQTADMKPRDPVSENMSFLTGKPTKAFIYQDHDAHIAVHTAMMQDPTVMGQMGQNPQAQSIMASIMAHIAEHVAFQYRSKLEERLGATLPQPDAEMPPEIEAEMSRLVAEAAQQLLTINKGKAAEQQAQQQAQDPLIQIKMQEVQIKGQEAATKAKKVDGDLAIAQQKLQQEQQPQGPDPMIAMQEAQQSAQIQGQQAQQQMAQQQQRHEQEMAALVHRQQLETAAAQERLLAAERQHELQLQQSKETHEQRLAQQRAQAAQNEKLNPKTGDNQ